MMNNFEIFNPGQGAEKPILPERYVSVGRQIITMLLQETIVVLDTPDNQSSAESVRDMLKYMDQGDGLTEQMILDIMQTVIGEMMQAQTLEMTPEIANAIVGNLVLKIELLDRLGIL